MGNPQKGKGGGKKDQPNNNTQDGTTEPNTEGSDEEIFDQDEIAQQFKHRNERGTDAYSMRNAKPVIDSKLVKNFCFFRDDNVKKLFENADIEVADTIKFHPAISVFRGMYKQTNKLVAIKIVDLMQLEASQRFHSQNDMHQRQRLKNKRIIHLHLAAEYDKKYIFLVLNYAERGSMEDVLRDNGALSERLAMTMFNQIAKGVKYMHSRKMAHRNLNLTHILVTNGFNTWLTGFKFSVIYDGRPVETFCGSAPFLPPEVLLQQPYHPYPADIWALGVVLFAMANDGLPYASSNDFQKLAKEQQSKQIRWRDLVSADLSPQFKALIGQILEPDPNARPELNTILAIDYVKSHKKKAKPSQPRSTS